MMAVAFKRLRPLFRKRSEINAEVTGRLGEALGGIRTVKVYTAEEREERIFADGIERLFRERGGNHHRDVGRRRRHDRDRRRDRRRS